MELNLEEMSVLANANASGKITDVLNKSEVALYSYIDLKNPRFDFNVAHTTVDNLAERGFLKKSGGSVKITEEGRAILKKSYADLQMLMLTLYSKMNA